MGEITVSASDEVAGRRSIAEVVGVGKRRVFSAAYKRRILKEVDRAGRGEIGVILRREGLYFSLLAKWRNGRNDNRLIYRCPVSLKLDRISC